MKNKSMLSSPYYRRWVIARDRALEELHTLAQRESTDEMRRLLTHVLFLAKTYYGEVKDPMKPMSIDNFDMQLKVMFLETASVLFSIIMRCRVRAYVLARASETEILAQLNRGKVHSNKIDRVDLLRIRSAPSFAGGPMLQRLQLYMDRLRRKVSDRVQTSALNAPDMESYLMDVLQSFPRRKRIAQPRRLLKPEAIREADKDPKPKVDIAIDFIEPTEWDDMLDAYKKEFVPKWRAPEYVMNFPTREKDEWYAWEFERDMTNEFVSAVRAGQVEAANAAGITDFVWVAVIDDKTDACCVWRDGLLVSEIKERLSAHKSEDDECRLENEGLVPPIHFNCRCTLAPASENIPDKPDDGAKEFSEWLTT